jgi:hypothetical protein
MEWLIVLGMVVASVAAVVVLAQRARRPDASLASPADDPHAGTIAEFAGQQGPRIYDD